MLEYFTTIKSDDSNKHLEYCLTLSSTVLGAQRYCNTDAYCNLKYGEHHSKAVTAIGMDSIFLCTLRAQTDVTLREMLAG